MNRASRMYGEEGSPSLRWLRHDRAARNLVGVGCKKSSVDAFLGIG